MKQEMVGRFMAMFAGILLATVTSVYANHTAIGQGTYAVDVDPPVSAEFHFVVAKRGPDRKLTPGVNFVQSAIEQKSGAMSFQTAKRDSTVLSTLMLGKVVDRTPHTYAADSNLCEEVPSTIFGEVIPRIMVKMPARAAYSRMWRRMTASLC